MMPAVTPKDALGSSSCVWAMTLEVSRPVTIVMSSTYCVFICALPFLIYWLTEQVSHDTLTQIYLNTKICQELTTSDDCMIDEYSFKSFCAIILLENSLDVSVAFIESLLRRSVFASSSSAFSKASA